MSTITLAICARNAQNIIGSCLESIERQSTAPDEIIVALDDLSDPTAEVARRHGARVIASNATGLYEARNAVLAACDTEYLAFTDADCVLTPDWVETVKGVLDERPGVAAGTGRHPPSKPRNFAAWLHHMWYVVEVTPTGETKHVIGGNSYFRTDALREAGGWLPLPGCSAAEDLYVSEALRRRGHQIWFEESAAASHAYETSLRGLWRKSVMMGRDIVIMLKSTGWYGRLWWYTLSIPVFALLFLAGVALSTVRPEWGLALVLPLLGGSYLYFAVRFRNPVAAVPRWLARWILIWPYSWGILKGLVAPAPKAPTRHTADSVLR